MAKILTLTTVWNQRVGRTQKQEAMMNHLRRKCIVPRRALSTVEARVKTRKCQRASKVTKEGCGEYKILEDLQIKKLHPMSRRHSLFFPPHDYVLLLMH